MPRDRADEKWLRENNEHYDNVCGVLESQPLTDEDIRSFIIAQSNLAVAKEVARLNNHLSNLIDLANLVRI